MLWFIMSDDEISGPFSEEHVKSTCDEKSLIWGANMSEWKNKADWVHHLENFKAPEATPAEEHVMAIKVTPEPAKEPIVKAASSVVEEPHKPVQETTALKKEPEKPSPKWYYASNKEKFGPFNETELIQILKMLNFSEPIYLWHKGLKGWEALEAFAEIHSQITTSEAA